MNLSPKGLESLRVINPQTVAYLDLTAKRYRNSGRTCARTLDLRTAQPIVRGHPLRQNTRLAGDRFDFGLRRELIYPL